MLRFSKPVAQEDHPGAENVTWEQKECFGPRWEPGKDFGECQAPRWEWDAPCVGFSELLGFDPPNTCVQKGFELILVHGRYKMRAGIC